MLWRWIAQKYLLVIHISDSCHELDRAEIFVCDSHWGDGSHWNIYLQFMSRRWIVAEIFTCDSCHGVGSQWNIIIIQMASTATLTVTKLGGLGKTVSHGYIRAHGCALTPLPTSIIEKISWWLSGACRQPPPHMAVRINGDHRRNDLGAVASHCGDQGWPCSWSLQRWGWGVDEGM